MTTENSPRSRLEPAASPRHMPRLAILASLALVYGCVDGGPSAPETNLENSAPVANAGTDQTVFTQALVSLDGGGSTDADGDALTFSWEFDSRPARIRRNPERCGDSEPDVHAGCPGQLRHPSDGCRRFPGQHGHGQRHRDGRRPSPVASAGPDQGVSFSGPGVTVQLNGDASSDPSNLPLTYSWEILSFVPASGVPPAADVVLANPTAVDPSFAVTAADQLGQYTLRLTVNNGSLSSSDQVVVTVAECRSARCQRGT